MTRLAAGDAEAGGAWSDPGAADDGGRHQEAGRPEPVSPTGPGYGARRSHLLGALAPATCPVARCGRCHGTRLGRWGPTRRGLQRWRCRGCGRTCSAATGTALSRVHSLDALRLVAADMLAVTPRSCRALAVALGLDRMTVWRWRRLVAAVWADHRLADAAPDAAAAAGHAVVLRESRKASREWVRHQRDPLRCPAPDRLRWIDYRQQHLPLPEPMSRYRVPVVLPSRTSGTPRWHAVDEPVPPGAPGHLPLCGRAAAPCSEAPAHRSCDDRHAEPLPSPPNLVPSLFLTFLAPFTGPATRHLPTYVAWFHARLHGTV